MDIDKRILILEAYVNKMPPFSVTVTKVLEICNDLSVSTNDLGKVISLDPVLMGKVLKLINSAYYGMRQQVTSMVRAIIMLGTNTIKNLVLSSAILTSLGNRKNFCALDMNDFWKHSLSVGVTSKLIAKQRKVNLSQIEEYFTAGLLHDIGKIPLNDKFSDEYVKAMDLTTQINQPLYICERKVLGLDHSAIGVKIAESWKLNQEIIDTLNYHHRVQDYGGDYKDVVYTVAVANYLVNLLRLGCSGDQHPINVDPRVYRDLGISFGSLKTVINQVNQEIEKALIFLNVAA